MAVPTGNFSVTDLTYQGSLFTGSLKVFVERDGPGGSSGVIARGSTSISITNGAGSASLPCDDVDGTPYGVIMPDGKSIHRWTHTTSGKTLVSVIEESSAYSIPAATFQSRVWDIIWSFITVTARLSKARSPSNASTMTLDLAELDPSPAGNYTNLTATVNSYGQVTVAASGQGGGTLETADFYDEASDATGHLEVQDASLVVVYDDPNGSMSFGLANGADVAASLATKAGLNATSNTFSGFIVSTYASIAFDATAGHFRSHQDSGFWNGSQVKWMRNNLAGATSGGACLSNDGFHSRNYANNDWSPIVGKNLRAATSSPPASSSDTGSTGQIQWDSNYIYIAVGTNSWKRSALSTF